MSVCVRAFAYMWLFIHQSSLINYFFSDYISPEYFSNGVVSTKTDVFSYGVLLLEIVSDKKNISRHYFDHPFDRIGYVSFSINSL